VSYHSPSPLFSARTSFNHFPNPPTPVVLSLVWFPRILARRPASFPYGFLTRRPTRCRVFSSHCITNHPTVVRVCTGCRARGDPAVSSPRSQSPSAATALHALTLLSTCRASSSAIFSRSAKPGSKSAQVRIRLDGPEARDARRLKLGI